jgi:hypothetical protein
VPQKGHARFWRPVGGAIPSLSSTGRCVLACSDVNARWARPVSRAITGSSASCCSRKPAVPTPGRPTPCWWTPSAVWPYRRECAITRNKQYLFSLQCVTDSSWQALGSHADLAPLVDHQPASACRKFKAAILQGLRSSIVGVASHAGDVQRCSYPAIVSRRTFPPVGPMRGAYAKPKGCLLGTGAHGSPCPR